MRYVNGLQEMVKICEEHAAANDLMFSSDPDPTKSNTLCIAFNCPNKEQLASINLNGNALPWKISAKHIGNILHENGTMEKDIEVKRAKFIDVCHNLNNEFETLPIECQIKMLRLYNSHFTGSCLWNFKDNGFRKISNSWNVNLKAIMDLPVNTHNYIVEQVSGGNNAKKMMWSRYIKFVKSLVKNKKPCISSLFKIIQSDIRSVTASNLKTILLETDKLIIPGTTNKWT